MAKDFKWEHHVPFISAFLQDAAPKIANKLKERGTRILAEMLAYNARNLLGRGHKKGAQLTWSFAALKFELNPDDAVWRNRWYAILQELQATGVIYKAGQDYVPGAKPANLWRAGEDLEFTINTSQALYVEQFSGSSKINLDDSDDWGFGDDEVAITPPIAFAPSTPTPVATETLSRPVLPTTPKQRQVADKHGIDVQWLAVLSRVQPNKRLSDLTSKGVDALKAATICSDLGLEVL